ncbi:hypothetical protein IEQ34_002585 [Dendrobium chrysotoxum]|uniref:Uncharacterized protein n=1 Tax=Dendrobium chrysotoxum TaxID=161865 RepID=A0AAV7HI01_DENCH|nr:hypothetical protein IEQ34_002585 [Dendrobium chrysotoxum]
MVDHLKDNIHRINEQEAVEDEDMNEEISSSVNMIELFSKKGKGERNKEVMIDESKKLAQKLVKVEKSSI